MVESVGGRSPTMLPVKRCLSLLLLGLTVAVGQALAQATALPSEVDRALQASRLPPQALALWVAPLEAPETSRWTWRETQPHNPASLAKLVTTWAALEQLGPAWRWRTPVWVTGPIDPRTGVLRGDLVLQGRGDPTLVLERLWLLLRRVQQLGIREIQGDIILDSRAFAPDSQQPGDFDGEAWRPGNVRPDALLFNFKSWTLQLQPDPARGVAWLTSDLPLPLAQDRVPIKPGPCTDPRGSLQANWLGDASASAQPLRLAGHLPSACGEQRWPLADADPASFNGRLLLALWREMGGSLKGKVRAGEAPAREPPRFEWTSLALAEVVRDINKHSNNLMAEQLALTLALQSGTEPVDAAAARAFLQRWLQQRMGWEAGSFVWDNASGLSRQTRMSAQQLGQLLVRAWQSPVMPEFVASLPLAGLDGTLSREPGRFGEALARAHMKTGSLRDVSAVAGYLIARSGKRYAVVALLQHPQVTQGRAVLDAVLRSAWAD
jgi:serine-type D-Ala-D-Ala carboxypeptidase/endopeptidase (penicillin-binding protein 4)